jgi:hypothetical protein
MSEVILYRYLRPLTFDETRIELSDGPTGGITFKFIIDQDNDELSFFYARCHDEVNFDRQIAKNIVDGRSKSHKHGWCFPYNRSISLIDNVKWFLKENTIYQDEEQRELKKYIKIISNHNTVQKKRVEILINGITNKVVKELALYSEDGKAYINV